MASRTHCILLITLASGAAALIYQVVWQRWFQILFGNTAHSSSVTLCAFFAGLAIGAEIFGRVASRTSRPLVIYAAIESVAALTALLVPLVFHIYDFSYPSLYENFANDKNIFLLVKFSLAMLVMLPPAILLGGTLPLLVTASITDVQSGGRDSSMIYGVNIIGAALGTAAGALWLPELVGLRGTYGLGIALSLACAIISLLVANRTRVAPQPRVAVRRSTHGLPSKLIAIAFVSGFCTLALEVFLIQGLSRIFDQTVYSYGVILLVVLLSLGVASLMVSLTAGRVSAQRMLGFTLVLQAIMLLVLPKLLERLTYLGGSGPGDLWATFRVAIVYGGPPMLIGGLVLPLTFRIALHESIGRRMGSLLAANTLGGILGSVAASFLFLETLGLWVSIAVLGLGYGVLALVTGRKLRNQFLSGAIVVAMALFVFLGPGNPVELPKVWLKQGESLVAVREGAYGVVSVVEDRHVRRMKLNNHYTLSGSGDLDAWKSRAGHLPLLLHPQPRNVLFVGSATGNTAGAAVHHPVEQIGLVEIVPEVQELAAEYFTESNRGVYDDPRTRRIIEDGRNHLRATEERYDVIVADLFSPWRPGVGSLYSREHFDSVRKRLTSEGVFCQWLPLYQLNYREFSTIAATFLDAFPNATLWRGDFYASYSRVALIGFADRPPRATQVEARTRELSNLGVEDRWLTDPRGLWMLYVGPLRGAKAQLERAPRNDDNFPVFEYIAGQSATSERKVFKAKHWPEFTQLLMAEGERSGFPFGRAVMGKSRLGAMFTQVNALYLQRRTSEFLLARKEFKGLMPADLVATPDPTVAEMWLQPR